MSLSSEEHDLIEKYVGNLLSKQEEVLFQDRYQSSELFKKEADFQKNLVNTMVSNEKERQKERLLKDYREFKVRNHSQSNFNRRNLVFTGIAATILIVSFLALLDINRSSETLFDAYYTPYSGPDILRGESIVDDMVSGLSLYKQQQYKEALNIFEKLLNQDSLLKDELNILIGVCYIESNHTEKSRSHFDQVKETKMKFIGEWYYNMALLKDGKYEEMKANMINISTSNSPYRNKAKELLKELP